MVADGLVILYVSYFFIVAGVILILSLAFPRIRRGDPQFEDYGERMIQNDYQQVAREALASLTHHQVHRPGRPAGGAAGAAGAAGAPPASRKNRKQTSRRKRRNNQHGI
jgi:hypothetical protein